MKSSFSTVRFLEELSLNAWPALQTHYLNGWLLRFSEGYTHRANSVQPLYPGVQEADLVAQISHCEQIYAHVWRQDAVFKMTEAGLPPSLDTTLAECGYQRVAETSVQTLTLSDVSAPALSAGQITLESQLSDAWVTTYAEMVNVSDCHRRVLRQALNNIISPSAYAIIRHNGETVAIGRAVMERGYMGVFDIHTALQWRGQGFGTQLVSSLLVWGQEAGATSAYLQVMRNNPAALRLYAKLGFVEAYSYWYRVKADQKQRK